MKFAYSKPSVTSQRVTALYIFCRDLSRQLSLLLLVFNIAETISFIILSLRQTGPLSRGSGGEITGGLEVGPLLHQTPDPPHSGAVLG